MAREKETGKARRLVVTGCLAQRYDEELRREIPEIDATLGTNQVEDVLGAVEGGATVTGARVDLRYARPDRALPPGLREDQRGCSVQFLHHPPCYAPIEAARWRTSWPSALARAGRVPHRPGLHALRARPGMRDGLAKLRRLGGVEGVRWIRIMYAYPATVMTPSSTPSPPRTRS
jgi:ribosomal protein S12 methylthiotransferase